MAARQTQMKEIRQRDNDVKRQSYDPLAIKKRGWAKLIDHNDNEDVVMEWDFHPVATRKGWFRLTIGKETVVLHKEQLQFYLRNV